jgi:hypothetical protein
MVLKCKNVLKAINYALQDCSRLFVEQLGSPGQSFGQSVIMLENVIKLIGFESALTHVFFLWSKGPYIAPDSNALFKPAELFMELWSPDY